MICAGIRLEVRVPGQKIDDEEEKDARDKINAQGMNVPGALPFDKLVRQTPRFEEKKTERLEKALVEIQERVGRVGQERSKGSVIIDRRLAALRAVGTAQGRATVFAVRKRRPRLLLSLQPLPAWITA